MKSRSKLKTKVLSLFLVFAMVLATPLGDLMSVTAKAASFDTAGASLQGAVTMEGTGVKYAWYTKSSFAPNGDMMSKNILVFTKVGDGTHRIPDYADINANKPWKNIALDEVYIEDGVEGIGTFAFAGQNSLKIVSIGGDVQTIGNSAFQGCKALGTIDFGAADALTTIGNDAFRECGTNEGDGEQLTVLDLSHCTNLQTIGNSAFSGCKKMTTMQVDSTKLRSIGSSAFYQCSKLTSFNMPHAAALQSIGNSAFHECAALTNVTIAGATDLQSIGTYAFYNCDRLVTVDFSGCKGTATLGRNAFYSCNALQTLHLPGLSSIGNSAISECTSLKNISFCDPSALVSIGTYAFGRYSVDIQTKLSGLEDKIDFSKFTNLTTLGEGAFYGRGLGTVDLSKTKLTIIPRYAFYRSGITGDLHLPDTLVTINDSAFNSNGMTSVTIPENVVTIGSSAFIYNKGLSDITINTAKLTALGDAAFGADATTAHLSIETVEGVDVRVGQNIRFSDAAVAAGVPSKFENEKNCYLGTSGTMIREPERDVAPTCTEPGKIAYSITYRETVNGATANVTKWIFETGKAALGHDPVQDVAHSVEQTCEQGGYQLWVCQRDGCDYQERQNESAALGHNWDTRKILPTAGAGGFTQSYCTRCDAVQSVSDIENATGYNWVKDSVVNVTSTADGSITFRQGEEDVPEATYTVTVPSISITVPSGTRIKDLPLPAVNEEEGTLTWKTPDALVSKSNGDKQNLTAVFTPNKIAGAAATASTAWKANPLQVNIDVEVNVTIGTISFADTRFTPAQVVQATPALNPKVENIPVGAVKGSVNTTYNSSMIAGESYTISAVFTYDINDYRVDDKSWPAGYSLSVSGDTATLTYNGHVLGGDPSSVVVSAAPTRTYDGTAKPMIYFSPLPADTTVTYYNGANVLAEEKLPIGATSSEALTTTNAGTYPVTKVKLVSGDQTVEKDGLGINVVVNPKPLIVPTGKNLTWNGTLQTGVVFDNAAAGVLELDRDKTLVTVIGAQNAIANDYSATLWIQNSNYCWASNGTDNVTVPYTIAKRVVTIPTTRTAADGSELKAAYTGSVFSAVVSNGYAEDCTVLDGTTLKVYSDNSKSTLLYTVEHAAGVDAKQYTPIARLYGLDVQWSDGTADPKTLSSFTITPAVLDTTGLSISATPVTYDGHDHKTITVTPPVAWVDPTISYKVYNSYRMDSASEVSEAINAGTYYVRVTVEVDNYAPVTRDVTLVIKPAPAPVVGIKVDGKRLTDETRVITFDGNTHTMTPYIVSGLVPDEKDNDPTGGRWVISTTGRAGGSAADDYGVTFTLEHPNYESAQVTGSMIIAKHTQDLVPAIYAAGTHTLLTDGTLTKAYGDPGFTLVAVRRGETVAAGGRTLESSDPAVAVVDNNTGMVTVKGQGTTTITITYTGDENWDQAVCTLSLTVEAAEQTVEASSTDNDVTVDNENKTINVTYEPNNRVVNMSYVAKADYGEHEPTGAALTYASSKADVATVDESGNITIKSAGTTTITVTAAATSTCKQKEEVFSLTVAPAELTVEVTAYDAPYDAAKHPALTVNSVVGVGSDTDLTSDVTVTYSTDGTNYSDDMPTVTNVADSKTVYYRVSYKNYATFEGSVTATVSKADLTATAADQSKAFLAADLPNGENFSASYSGIADDTDTKAAIETELNAHVQFLVKELDGEGAPTGSDLSGNFASLNAGTYAIIPVFSGYNAELLANYNVVPANGTLTVARITGSATITQDDVNFPEQPNPVVTSSTHDTATKTLTYEKKNPSSDAWESFVPGTSIFVAGTYRVKATLPANNGYDAVTTDWAEFTVNPTAVQVTLADQSVVYDGAAVETAAYANATANIVGSVVTYKFYTDPECKTLYDGDGKAPTIAGTYYLKATATCENYSDGFAIGKFVITPAPVAITLLEDGVASTAKNVSYGDTLTLTYDLVGGTASSVEVEAGKTDYVTASLDTSAGIVTLTVTQALSTPTDVKVTFTAAPDASGNYQTGTADYNLTITQAAINAVVTAYEAEYDGAVHNAASAWAVKFGATDITTSVTSYFSTTELTALNYSTAGSTMPQFTVANADGTTVYYYVDGGTNYASISGSFVGGKISPKAIGIQLQPQSHTYDGTVPTADSSSTKWALAAGSALAAGDTLNGLNVALSIENAAKNAGSYDIAGTWNNSNYVVTFLGGTGAFTVDKRAVNVTIADKSSVYGEALKELTCTLPETVLAADKTALQAAITLTKAEGDDAGTYNITGSCTHNDYAVAFNTATYTIERKDLTGSGISAAVTGTYTYNGAAQEPTLTVTYSAPSGGTKTLAKGTDYTVSCLNNTNAKGESETGYPSVTITGTGNYQGSLELAFTIAKADLTVTAQPASKKYGEAYPTFTVNYGTLLGSDTAATVFGGQDVTYTVKEGDTVKDADDAIDLAAGGTYTIHPSGLTADNYSISYASAALTVTQRTLDGTTMTTTLGSDKPVYDGAAHAAVITVVDNLTTLTKRNLVKDVDYTVSYQTSAGAAVKGEPVDAGTYNVYISGKGNYVSSAPLNLGSFTIQPKTGVANCTVALTQNGNAVTPSTYTYDGAAKTPVVTVTDADRSVVLTPDKDYTVVLPTNGSGRVDAGSYTVTVQFRGNYEGAQDKTATYEIQKKNLSNATVAAPVINLAEYDNIYTGTAKEPVATVTYNGLTLTKDSDYTVAYAANINAGTATVTVTGKGTNYEGVKTKTFTINKATLSASFVNPVKIVGLSATDINDLTLNNTHTGDAATGLDGVAFTYTSNNTAVATVTGDATAATVTTTTAGGFTTITVEVDGSSATNYSNSVSASYLVNAHADASMIISSTVSGYMGVYDGTAHGPEIQWANPDEQAKCTVTYGTAADLTGASYTSDVPTLTNVGELRVYYKIKRAGYNDSDGSVILKITPADAGLSFTNASVSTEYAAGKRVAIQSLTKDTDQTSITYTSSVPAVASVSGTELVLKQVGTTVITASAAATTNYKGGTASYILTVTEQDLSPANVTVASGTYTYKGTQHQPAVTVELGGITLTAGTDYTVTYTDNIDAGTATVTVTGKGSYTGEATAHFTIGKAALTAMTLSSSQGSYTGAAVPVIVNSVSAGTNTGLQAGRDYTLSYTKADGSAIPGGVPKDVGSYHVIATAAAGSNYSGSVQADFEVVGDARLITIALQESGVDVNENTYTYDGSEKRPDTIVKVNGNTLTKGTDYTVAYTSNTHAGTATVTVSITGQSLSASKSFTIKPKTLTASDVGTLSFTATYNGTMQTPDAAAYLDTKLGAGCYDLFWSNAGSTNADTYTISVVGKQDYTGSQTLSYTISPADISSAVLGGVESGYAYTGSAVKPVPTVTVDHTPLTQNVDFAVAYSVATPKDAGSYTVTIKGIGNYTGNKSTTFAITAVTPSLQFASPSVSQQLTVNGTYSANPLNVPEDYPGTITYSSSNTAVAEVNATTGVVTMKALGTTIISATSSATTNYNATTAAYSLTLTGIEYTAAGYNGTYDGNAHSVTVTATSPADAAVTYTYTDESGTAHNNDATPPSYTKAGIYSVDYTITAAGCADVSGTLTVNIAPKTLTESMVSGVEASYTYTGSAITPVPTVTDATIASTDYEVSYGANTAMGTGSVTVTGKGNYTGTVTKYFNITAADVTADPNAKLAVTLSAASFTYNGSVQKPATVTVTYTDTNVTTPRALTEGTDYTLVWQNSESTNKGDYTVTAMGKGNYNLNSAPVTYTIAAQDISAYLVEGLNSAGYAYTGSAITPAVTVRADALAAALTEGTDYTVAYTNNTAVGTATVTVTGIGNYTGTASADFAITQNTTGLQVSFTNSTVTRTFAENLTFAMADLNTLSKGTSTGAVTYTSSNPAVAEVTDPATGALQIHAAGSVWIRADVAADTNYGAAFAMFTLNIEKRDLSKSELAQVTMDTNPKIYTGSEVKPAPSVQSLQTGTLIPLTADQDYTVSYANNVEAGTNTASVTVTGKGNYTGTVTMYFSIQAPGLTVAPLTYTGSALTPTITVTMGGTPLTQDTHYTVSYKDSSDTAVAAPMDVGSYTVIITGLGTYAGSVITGTCTVNAADISAVAPTLTPTSAAFTGSDITPDVSMVVNGRTLTEGTDYTVSYKDASGNTVTAPNALGTYTVTVTGIGNYAGSETTASFEVTTTTLAAAVVTAPSLTYTGSALAPSVTVTLNGTPLTETTDYTVSYKDASGNTVTAPDAVGTYTVVITGVGNYAGSTATGTFEVTQKPNSNLTVTLSSSDFTYDGAAKTPTVTVTDADRGGAVLTEADYTVAIRDASGNPVSEPTTPGTYTVVVTYQGSYTGSETATYTITSAALSGTITVSGAPFAYTGSAITPAVSVAGLTEGTDYTVAYSSNIAAGTATVTLTGKGNYSGTLSENFTIDPAALQDSDLAAIPNQLYTGSAIQPAVVVSFGGRTLTKGTDYTVAYTNNTSVGVATATVTGTGNFSGTASKTFIISAGAAAAMDARLNRTTFTYNGSVQRPTITVVTHGGNILTAADYDATIPASQNAGTYTVTITGKNGYDGGVSLNYTIEPAALSGDVTIPGTYTYTGSAIIPSAVNVAGLDPDTDYTVACTNNTAAGTANVTLTGKGNYTGTLTSTFPIAAKAIDEVQATPIADVYDTGSAQEPALYLTYQGSLLVKDRDYTVAYSNNSTVGTATATVTGIGNYSGTRDLTFRIVVGASSTMAATLEQDSFTYYSFAQIRPAVVSVTFNGTPLTDANYDVTYADADGNPVSALTDAGTYSVIITGKNGYIGVDRKTVVVQPAALMGTVSVPGTYTYTGSAIEPSMVLVDGLTQGTDYTAAFSSNTNAGTATVTLTGKGNYTSTLTGSFTIAPKDISEVTAAAIGTQYDNGSPVTPPVYLSMNGRLLTQGTDFTVTYANNDKVGTATITVTGQGNFTGTRQLTFEIKEKQTIVSGGGGGGGITMIPGGALDEGIVINVTSSQIKEADGKVIIHAENVPTNVDFKVVSDGPAKLDVAITETTPGTVVAEVRPDGTLAIVKNAVLTKNGVLMNVNGTKDYRVYDNSKWFIDVSIDRWSYENVAFVTARELFNGTTVSTFSPSMNMTRNMLMTVLARLDDADTSISPYEQGMAWAVANGVSDGTNGNAQITREQLVTMLYRYAKLKGYDTTIHTNLSAYADQGSVGAFAREALTWAVERGIMNGTTATTLSPKAYATREQVATFLARFCYALY